jgi:flavodoxin I
MESLVIYDSVFGNTEAIARAVARGLPKGTGLMKAASARGEDLQKLDLLVVGSPTLGGRPSEAMQKLIDSIAAGALAGVKVAAFDTRMSMAIARLFGYAADRMAASLSAKGAVAACPPQGFIVKGRSGPLSDGQEEKATAWARGIAGG